MTAVWKAMFLAEKYGRLTLTLDEVAEQVLLAPQTIRNRRVRGEFQWLIENGNELVGDVFDVTAHLQAQCSPEGIAANIAREKAHDAAIAHAKTIRRIANMRRHAVRRCSLVRRRTPPWADRAAILSIYREARRLTLETGVPHHVDHEVPLRGAIVSGLHVQTNLRVIPARQNIRKSNRFNVE